MKILKRYEILCDEGIRNVPVGYIRQIQPDIDKYSVTFGVSFRVYCRGYIGSLADCKRYLKKSFKGHLRRLGDIRL